MSETVLIWLTRLFAVLLVAMVCRWAHRILLAFEQIERHLYRLHCTAMSIRDIIEAEKKETR
jgi:hypothetical protein